MVPWDKLKIIKSNQEYFLNNFKKEAVERKSVSVFNRV